MRMLRRYLKRRPEMERALCSLFLSRRLRLPALSLEALEARPEPPSPVMLRQMPRGAWSTPLADSVGLVRLAQYAAARRVLEVGSFRGYTALLLAQHLPDGGRVVTVDHNPQHGEAYRDTPYAASIERRVGKVGRELFAGDPPGSYDLIFLDAGHRYPQVRHDTEVLLPLVAPGGFFVWHDYANWGYLGGQNGVPEYLHELAARVPIAALSGTALAVHSPAWAGPGRGAFDAALARSATAPDRPWETALVPG